MNRLKKNGGDKDFQLYRILVMGLKSRRGRHEHGIH